MDLSTEAELIAKWEKELIGFRTEMENKLVSIRENFRSTNNISMDEFIMIDAQVE